MKTIWVLAKNRHAASEALRKNLKDRLAENDFIDFRYLATPHCVEETGGEFLVVQGWQQNPAVKDIAKALKDKGW